MSITAASDSNNAKDARMEIRLTGEQKSTIEAAAAIEGRSLSDFSMNVLVPRAEEVIRRTTELRVDAAYFDTFAQALDAPAHTLESFRTFMTQKSVFVD